MMHVKGAAVAAAVISRHIITHTTWLCLNITKLGTEAKESKFPKFQLSHTFSILEQEKVVNLRFVTERI